MGNGNITPPINLVATKVMVDAGCNTIEIANKLNVSRKQVQRYRKAIQSDLSRLDPADVQLLKDNLESYFLQRSVKSMDSMTEDKFSKAPLDKLAFTAKIMNDAYRLSSNQSTSNVSIHVSGVVEEIERQRKKEYTKKK